MEYEAVFGVEGGRGGWEAPSIISPMSIWASSFAYSCVVVEWVLGKDLMNGLCLVII